MPTSPVEAVVPCQPSEAAVGAGEGGLLRRGAFSIDLEDFSQLTCRDATGIEPPTSDDVARQVDVVLGVLAEQGVRATFFALGMVARARRDIVRRIHAAGHELASHGMQHVRVHLQTPQEFRTDVGESLALLSDLTGEPVRGYRAPVFSIAAQNLWALDVLAELGVLYDSSIVPVRLRRYGIAGFDPRPGLYRLPHGGRIVEIPPAVWRVGRRPLVAGGGYLRLLPSFLLRAAVDDLARRGAWLTVYLHPYEFDPQPLDVARAYPADVRMAWWRRRLLNAKWNLRRRSIVAKVRWLLATASFVTYGELARLAAAGPPRDLPAPAAH